jgi:hypothetical protein
MKNHKEKNQEKSNLNNQLEIRSTPKVVLTLSDYGRDSKKMTSSVETFASAKKLLTTNTGEDVNLETM